MNNPKPDKLPRVYRGGTWFDSDPAVVSAACRIVSTPSYRNFIIGFRCALRGREPVVKP